MPQNSRVLRLPGAPFVPLRLEYLIVSAENYCAAKILSLFEHWTNSRAESVEIETGEFAQSDDLWLEGNRLDHIQKRLLNEYGLKTISNAIQHLENLGFVLSRSGKGTDRTKAYRLEIQELNAAIAAISQDDLSKFVEPKRAETIVVKQSAKTPIAIGKSADSNRQNCCLQSVNEQILLYTIDNSSIDNSLDQRAREMILANGRKDAHEIAAALEQNYESAPQPIFLPRQPRYFTSEPPAKKFKGPWGDDCNETFYEFEAWVKDYAIATNKQEPIGWAHAVVANAANGKSHLMWLEFLKSKSGDQPRLMPQGPSIREAIAKELNCSDPLSGYGGSDFRIMFNNMGYTFESRLNAFKRKYANFQKLDEFIELAIYNGVLQPPSPDWFPTHPRQELEALVA